MQMCSEAADKKVIIIKKTNSNLDDIVVHEFRFMYSVALPADMDDSVLFSVTSNGHNDSYTKKTCRSDWMMNNFA